MATPENMVDPYPVDASRLGTPPGFSHSTARVGEWNRLEAPNRTFIYLDCGLWAGNDVSLNGGPTYAGQRSFGIVCGRTAVLCTLLGGGAEPAFNNPQIPIPAEEAQPILAVLRAIGGEYGRAGIVKYLRATTTFSGALASHNPRPDAVYVFLPDMHLPMITPRPSTEMVRPPSSPNHAPYHRYPADGAPNGRFEYYPQGDQVVPREHLELGDWSYHPPGEPRPYVSSYAAEWFDRYIRADIFQGDVNARGETASSGPADDLRFFMEGLASYTGQPPAHLVQLGDMFDLWIGFDMFFEATGDNDPRVWFRQPVEATREWVHFWLRRALNESRNRRAITELISAGSPHLARTWIYGNHDSYLRPAPPGHPEQANHPDVIQAIGPRVREFHPPGLYAEHGHRADSFNRDGAGLGAIPRGHSITNYVFMAPPIRSLDPDQRQHNIEQSAALWLNILPTAPFCIYVMAHSHDPYLTRVRIDGTPQR